MKKYTLLIVVVALIFYYYVNNNKTLYQFTGKAFGTSYTVKIVAFPLSSNQQKEISIGIENTLGEINDIMSTYIAQSEISLFNNYQKTDSFPLSLKTIKVLAAAQKISDMTSGAFDVTVAPLVNLWGFGQNKNSVYPTAKEIEKIRSIVGYKNIILNEEQVTIKKKHPELAIDLSAIAKGFAVDEVAYFLEKMSIADYMVEIGGEMRLAGHKYNQLWNVGIAQPEAHSNEVYTILSLTNCSIATSGDYRNFRYFEDQDKKYSHTINPVTGYPVEHSLASVTVITDNCMFADGLATGLMVLGEEGVVLAERYNLACYFIFHSDDGFITRETNKFSQLVRDGKEQK